MPCLTCVFVKKQSIQKDRNVLLPSGYYGCDSGKHSGILAGLICLCGRTVNFLCSSPSFRRRKAMIGRSVFWTLRKERN